MKWEAIRHRDGSVDQYAVRSECGEFTVCKTAVGGKVLYSAWNLKHQIGIRDSSEEAKTLAENFKQVGPG